MRGVFDDRELKVNPVVSGSIDLGRGSIDRQADRSSCSRALLLAVCSPRRRVKRIRLL
jgi:hypothetical protein